MFLQIWSQVNQLYTQVDPITSAYETSYLPKEVVYLPDLKQQVTLGFRDNKNKAWVKELDPRAVKFIPNFPKTTESFSQSAAFDWCDSTVNDHLNIVNVSQLERYICVTEPEKVEFEGFGNSMNLKFEQCDQTTLEDGQTCMEGDEL